MSERDLDLLESLWTLPPADPYRARGGDVMPHTGRPSALPGSVPVVTGLQRQGDLLVVPVVLLPGDIRAMIERLPAVAHVALTDVPVPVLASEHTHQLTGRHASWAPLPAGLWHPAQVVVGVLTIGAVAAGRVGAVPPAGDPLGQLEDGVPLERAGRLEDGGRLEPVAVLSHTGHHGALAIGPGRYLLRRQRAATPRPRPAATTHPATQPARRPTTWHPHQD